MTDWGEGYFDDDEDEDCGYPTPDGGDICIRLAGHPGLHCTRICNGICDTCECEEWSDDENDPLPPELTR